jgi:hypothetical protein
MKFWKLARLGTLSLGLVTTVACGHQSPVPASGVLTASDDDQLPFDRRAQQGGISPTSAVIPPGARVPSGTPVTIRLRSPLSSATARSGDTFDAVLDEPILVNEQVLAERGIAVIGRVMEAKPAGRSQSSGYLRLALSSISINGKSIPAHSSSNFVKGISRSKLKWETAGRGAGNGSLVSADDREARPAISAALNIHGNADTRSTLVARDVTVGPERRLTFRLTEPIPLDD